MTFLTSIIPDKRQRLLLGIALLFAGIVLIPYYTGQGPLSISPSPYLAVSVSYDKSSNSFFGSVVVLGGPDGKTSERLAFALTDADKRVHQIDSDPFWLEVSLKKQELLIPYRLHGYIGDAQCYFFHGEKDTIVPDYVGAALDGLDKLRREIGDFDEVFDQYIVIFTKMEQQDSFFGFGGRTVVDGYVCGIKYDAYAYYERSPDHQVYAEITAVFRNSHGEVTTPVTFTTEMGSGSEFTLVSNGRKVGTITFLGIRQGTDFPLLFSDIPSALIVPYETAEGSFSVAKADITYSDYVSRFENIKLRLEELFKQGNSNIDTLKCNQAVDIINLLIRFLNPVFFFVSLPGCETQTQFDYQRLINDIQAYHNQLLSDVGDTLSDFLIEHNEVPTDTIVLKRELTNTSAYAYELRFTVNADFVGVHVLAPDPKITKVDYDESSCTDRGCLIRVTLRNVSPTGFGLVTVSVDSDFFSHADATVYLPESGEEQVELFLQPLKKFTSPQSIPITVTALAHHWLESKKDVYTTTVRISPTKTCVFYNNPQCVFEGNTWYVLRCSSPYDASPQKVACGEGYACVSGQCVADTLKSVRCLDSKNYELVYQYSGTRVLSCDQGYICSDEKAQSHEVPPCIKATDTLPNQPHTVSRSLVKIREYSPDFKALSRGLILLGLALVIS